MNIQIERQYVEALMQRYPAHAGLADQLRFGDRVEMEFSHLSDEELTFLEDLYRQAGPDMKARAAQLATLRDALKAGGKRFEATELEEVLPAMVRYLTANAIRGWLFTASVASKPLPYVISRFDYVPASNDEAGKVMIELKSNAKGVLTTNAIRIMAADAKGRTINEILASKGYIRETPELIEAFDAATETYFDWRGRYGQQFTGRGTGFHAEDPNASHRDTDWSRKDVVVLSTSGGDARLVNDEAILSARSLTLESTGDVLGHFIRKARQEQSLLRRGRARGIAAADSRRAVQAHSGASLYSDVPSRSASSRVGACRRDGALSLPARAEAQAGAAGRADRPDRHPDRRDGRADGRHRRRQVGRHHRAVRRPARRRQDADRRGLFGDHPAPALSRAFGPARPQRRRPWRRR